jgi:hypothetical protein
MNVKTSIRRIYYLIVAAGLLALLSQCQPVPKPFAAAQKGDFSAIQIGPRAGVLVLPIKGTAELEAGSRLAHAMAKALRLHEITASTGKSHRRSHLLRGSIDMTPDGQLRLIWRLYNAAGEETMTVVQEETVRPIDWQQPNSALLARLADNGAAAIDRRLRREERGQGRRISLAPVALGPMDGVPGQGGRYLASAMQTALADAGVPLSEQPVDDGFVLLGSMRVTPSDGGTQYREIQIVWHLIRADGREFGKVSQANRVPAAQLKGDWRYLAKAIAQAGALGVLDLLRRDPRG